MKLSEFLSTVDFLSNKQSSEYVGTKDDNPAMVLEEGVADWLGQTDIDDLRQCVGLFVERVCIQGFPPRYSPQFWLAQAALTAIHKLMWGYVQCHQEEVGEEINELLFQLWISLVNAGPGSTHLEMMDIILKNDESLLWQYMRTLKGDQLKSLITTLKSEFVNEAGTSADHYATLMETHIDKIFKRILSPLQFEEDRDGCLDLQIFYLSRMNHVAAHIGPRLSHLCFLICNSYSMENPYMGMDDWVMMRQHLKVIREVITDKSFIVASEAQYRAPLILEKIFQAAVTDKMLELVFKDFMTLLRDICNYSNCRKCKKLFLVYQNALFGQIDLEKGFEVCPYWMFDQCILTLTHISGTNAMETHLEEFIISAQHQCLLKFSKLSVSQQAAWHNLLVRYVVSGRKLLVTEAKHLLDSPLLKENKVLEWKNHIQEVRMLIDIIADLPQTFIQDDDACSETQTIHAYVQFIEQLLAQLRTCEQYWKVLDNIHRCVIKCLEKDPHCKAGLALACLQSDIPDFQDVNFIREILFCVDQLLKDPDRSVYDEKLADSVEISLTACIAAFRVKGYISVDFNSLLMSISITCIMGAEQNEDRMTWSHDGHMTDSSDFLSRLYHVIVLSYIRLHEDKGSLPSISSIVPQIECAMREHIEQGFGIGRSADFLYHLATRCIQLVRDHGNQVLDLFLDWGCSDLQALVSLLYKTDSAWFIARFQDIFPALTHYDKNQKHCVLQVVWELCQDRVNLFQGTHVSRLFDMYPREEERSQDLILQIIGRIASSYPSYILPHYPALTDDLKFTPRSLTLRAPVLACLSQQNEDIAMATMDYLLIYVGNKESSVSLSAMETLQPLMRKNPGFTRKNKLRFKNLYKLSTCARFKELCAEVIPDVQTIPSTKTPKKEGRDVGKGLRKTPSETGKVTRTAVVSKSKSTLAKTVTAPDTLKGAQQKPDGDTQHTSEKQDKRENTWPGKEQKLGANTELDQAKNLIEDATKLQNVQKAEYIENVLKESGNHSVRDTKTVDDKNVGDTMNGDEPSSGDQKGVGTHAPSHSPTVDTDSIFIVKDPTVNPENVNESLKKSESGEIVPGIDGQPQTGETGKISSDHNLATTTQKMAAKSGGSGPDMVGQSITGEINTNQNLTTTQKTMEVSPSPADSVTMVPVSPELKCSMKGHQEPADSVAMAPIPPVLLCSTEGHHDKLRALQDNLKAAGYESCMIDKDTNMEEVIMAVKIVVCCIGCGVTDDNTEVVKTINLAKDKPMTVLYLKMHASEWPLPGPLKPLLGRTSYIRFYLKPGELPTKGDNCSWPHNKFCELLMQLNYNGVLPDSDLVTKDFKMVWQMQSSRPPTAEENVTVPRPVVVTASPDVFISYHWGKQYQIDPLYSHLCSLGLRCWMGAYQLVGTESLYNKITQGLHSSRLVLACITRKFSHSENCKREIMMAHRLNRPIIPLMIGGVTFPVGSVGDMLKEKDKLKIALTPDGCVDTNSTEGMEGLLRVIDVHVPNVIQFGDGPVTSEMMNKTKMQSNVSGKISVSDTEVSVKTCPVMKSDDAHSSQSDTVYRVPKRSQSLTPHSSLRFQGPEAGDRLHFRAADDYAGKKVPIPEGIIVNEYGHTVKSNRSKSCAIL